MLLPTARLDLFANGGTGEPLLFQNFQSSIMSVWLLCALLSSVVCQTEQDGHSCSIKDVKVNAEETDTLDNGVWVLNVAWRDELKAENNESRKVSYDIKVYRTESMTTVYDETILVTPDNTAIYHWNWTSPIPLQCTSHSVRLRRRDQHHIGEWTPLYTYKGQDLNAEKVIVYPRSEVFAVGSNITFCCILEKGKVPFPESPFLIPISNRTYITKPVHFDSSSNPMSSISCASSGGTTVLIGYPPDDHSLTCETSDFSSVKCRWETGRKTRLDGSRKTVYKLNGRACLLNECELPVVPNQVTNWTLIAKNPLGVKTLTDTADPTHRVCLRAPSKVSHTAYARSVTLQWHWNVTRYASFQMICQVMLNENTYNKTFHGLGLSLIVLDHLQPFAKYTVKVRCGSDEHFYKWGDWSDIIEFSTKEDIPETVDIWVQYFEQNTYVLWKPLTQQQSHGIITQYELAIGNRTEIIDIGLNTQMCYNITPGNERSDRNITMSAKNSAGLSPPSTVIVSGYHDNEVNIGRISSRNGGFDCLVWDEYFNSTCGYIIEWFPTYNETQCAVEWTKIPEYDHAACHTWKQKGIFKEGVKYTVSVYACIEDKPMLWKRSEGYAVEQKPSGIVQSLKGKQNGKNLELSWDEVPLQQQKGFIQGYTVKTFHSGSKIPVNTTVTKEPRVNLILDPGSYTFSVSAFTSGGEGDSAAFSMDMEKNIGQMTAATVAATLVFIIIAVLCYRKRKWLKKVLYPDIPEPKLAGKWTTKGIYCSQMTEGFMKCEIQEVHSSQCPHDLDLISSNSTVFPAQYFYQNISECPGDVSYYPPPWACAQKLTSIIENPSYDMTISEPVDVARKSEFTLEMQESYLPAPNFVQRDFVPEPVDVSHKSEFTLEMEDSYLPAPNFVLRDFVPETVDVAQISEHTLEMQDSYLPAPIFVQKDFVVKDSSGYKPQSA